MKKETKKLKLLQYFLKSKESGITLIALVITIIILLILAAVTFNVVLGEGGLIRKAQLAKNMTLNSTIAEQEKLNSLMEELEKNNEITTAEIEITNRGEDTITVKVNGENLNKYQFSMDGEHYTEEQSENEYTFTGLNKVIINETNYKTATGTEYTIYAKAKSKSGTEVTCIPVTTKTIVEVEGDANKFTYEDLGDEIYITGLKANNPNIISGTENEVQEYIKEPQIILIPSYINGKPVTKVSENFCLQNIEYGVDSSEARISLFDTSSGSILYDNVKYVNGKLETDKVCYWVENHNYTFYCMKGNTYASSTVPAFTNTITFKMKIKSSDIILPPTVKEITNSYTQANAIQLLNNKNSIQYLDIEIDPDEPEESTNWDIDLDDPTPPDYCHVYIFGKEDLPDIPGIEVISSLIGYDYYGDISISFIN